MSNLLTTHQLLDEYWNLIEEKEYLELPEEEVKAIDAKLVVVEQQMTHKIDNIRDLKLELNRRKSVIDSEKAILKAEVDRLSKRAASFDKINERIDGLSINLLETIGKPNKSGNPSIQTDLATYSVVSRWSKLDITDIDKIPDDCLEIAWKYNNIEMRKRVIDAGGETEYGVVTKKKGLQIR